MTSASARANQQAPKTAYEKLEKIFHDKAVVDSALGILRWDRDVMMPHTGNAQRGRQLGMLGEIAHGYLNAPDTARLIEQAAGEELTPAQQGNLRLMKKAHMHATALSPEQVRRMAELQTTCLAKWQEARAANDFKIVMAPFNDLLKMTQDVAAATGERLGLGPYDALLDSYTPGNNAQDISAVFNQLKKNLPGLLKTAQEKCKDQKKHSFHLPDEAQEKLIRDVIAATGFNLDAGRLDIVPAHPFSSGYAGDSRITVRLTGDGPLFPLLTAMHETGHALYDAGCDPEAAMSPVRSAQSMGMAMHESQALLHEKVIGRTGEFWHFVAHKAGLGWKAEDMLAQATAVIPGLVRITADEIAYPLHIILRFDLERAMIDGKLSAADLPDAWNAGMQDLFGISPGKDLAKGCLQDVHWFDGAFGYFPAYALGHIHAVQMFNKMKTEKADFLTGIATGDFSFLQAWLNKNIYAPAATLSPPDLMEKATGQKTDPAGFIDYLTKRYT